MSRLPLIVSQLPLIVFQLPLIVPQLLRSWGAAKAGLALGTKELRFGVRIVPMAPPMCPRPQGRISPSRTGLTPKQLFGRRRRWKERPRVRQLGKGSRKAKVTKGQGQEYHGRDKATKDTGKCLDGAFPAQQFSRPGKDAAQAPAMVSLLPGYREGTGSSPCSRRAHPGMDCTEG